MITQLTLEEYKPFLDHEIKYRGGQIIWQKADYRIKLMDGSMMILDYISSDDFNYQYTHEANPDTPPDELIKLKRAHVKQLIDTGLYGVILEKWNPEIDKGWEHVDGIWFIEFDNIPQVIDGYFTIPYDLYDLQ